jgi:hypothetical protein
MASSRTYSRIQDLTDYGGASAGQLLALNAGTGKFSGVAPSGGSNTLALPTRAYNLLSSFNRWKRHGRRALIYASWGYQPPSTDHVFTTYRLRFGIESSHRQMHEGRIQTATRRPAVRLLFVGNALVLRNIWE